MGTCNNCAKKSYTIDKYFDREAKKLNTIGKRKIVDESAFLVLKTSVSRIFNNTIGVYVHETFIEEEYRYSDDILNDLQCYESNIISLSTHKITNDKLIKYEWNDIDCEILHKLLLQIFKDKATSIDALIEEFTPRQFPVSLMRCSHDELLSNLPRIVSPIFADNETCTAMVQYVETLLVEKRLDGHTLANMSKQTFVALAKTYHIPAAKATKLLQAFKQHPFHHIMPSFTASNDNGEEGQMDDDLDAMNREIMNDMIAKSRTLKLCQEQHPLDCSETHKGFIQFLEHYLLTKNVNDIFHKSHITDCIRNSRDLLNVLQIAILLYRLKTVVARNEITNLRNATQETQKTRIDKTEIMSVSRYMSSWIVLNYGSNGFFFKMDKIDFQNHIYLYFEIFLKQNHD